MTKDLKTRVRYAKEHMSKQMTVYENEKRHKEYAEQQKELKASPEFIRNATVRKMLQEVSIAENEATDLMINETEELSAEIYDIICNALGYGRKASKFISFAEIEDVFNQCLVAIKKLRVVSENPNIVNRAINKKYNAFDRLIDNLIKLDVRFAVFGTKKILSKNSLQGKLNTLPENLKEDFELRKQKLEQDENADYINEQMVCEFESNSITTSIETVLDKEQHFEDEASLTMLKATCKLSENLYEFIKTQLGLEEGKQKQIKYSEINSIITVCMTQLQQLKKLCVNPYIAKNAYWEFTDEYTSLFNKLIDLDIHFVIYAPMRSLCRVGIHYELLNEDEKDVVFARLIKYGLTKDADLIDYYKDVFAAQIEKHGITI